MDNNEQTNSQQTPPVNQLTKSLIGILEKSDKRRLNIYLKNFKFSNGAVNFVEVFKIPTADRVPSLVNKLGEERVYKLIGAAITLALEALNLKQSLSEDQIFDLTDNIAESSNEDYLSLEDIVLFLQRLVRGESGQLFNSIDIPVFLTKFEKYRQERHVELMRIREEEQAQFRSYGGGSSNTPNSVQLRNDEDPKSILDLMQTFYSGKDEDMA